MPQGVDDSSGDEQETQPKSPTAKRKRNSLEKHQRFENKMNRCNALDTRVTKLMDEHKRMQWGMPSQNSTFITDTAGGSSDVTILPPFNPAIPPPRFIDVR